MLKSATNNRQRLRRNSSSFCCCCYCCCCSSTSDIIADQNRREIDVDVDGNAQREKIAPLCLLLYLFVGLSRLSTSSMSELYEFRLQTHTFSAQKLAQTSSACGKSEWNLKFATNDRRECAVVQMDDLDFPCFQVPTPDRGKKTSVRCEGCRFVSQIYSSVLSYEMRSHAPST